MRFRIAHAFGGLLILSGGALAASTAPAPSAPASDASTCGDTKEVDRCLVGNWEMTVDGAQEFARKNLHGAKVSIPSHVGNRMTMSADGTFATAESSTKATVDKDGMHAESAMTGQASGRWSAAEGKLNFCASKAHFEGTATVSAGGKKTNIPLQPKIPSVATSSYMCAGDTFTQTMHIGKAGDIVSTFKRIP